MEARQRKKVANAPAHGALKRGKTPNNNTGGAIQNSICLFVFIIAFVLLAAIFEDFLPWKVYSNSIAIVSRVPIALGLVANKYAVIIDAGSTGSRVLAFTFRKSLSDDSLRLEDELFVEAKPGLSSFADNPKEGAQSVAGLLKKAKAVIPESEWKNTPLSLKATAGLRLLPEKKADALLEEVKNTFRESGFMVSDNSVSIMGGMEEGIFSWFTVNLLLGRLGRDLKRTMTALDLGGGSTQITFAPTDPATIKNAPEGYIEEVSAFKHKMKLYTYSYLGLGLMAARKSILLFNNTKSTKEVRSPCVNPSVQKKWNYSGATYTVMGPENPSYKVLKGDAKTAEKRIPVADFDKCLEIVSSIVNEHVHQASEINGREVVAFSYYFDRAVDTGLIDIATGGTVKVGQFFKTAREACDNADVDHPLLCLDMTYIATLLSKGFGLANDHSVKLVKKIDGHETSWALGAAYNILENGL